MHASLSQNIQGIARGQNPRNLLLLGATFMMELLLKSLWIILIENITEIFENCDNKVLACQFIDHTNIAEMK